MFLNSIVLTRTAYLEQASQWGASEFDSAVATMLAEGNTKNFPLFITGSVLEDAELVNMNSEHMSSFNYGYNIEGIRDWLFQQHK